MPRYKVIKTVVCFVDAVSNKYAIEKVKDNKDIISYQSPKYTAVKVRNMG